MAAATRVSIQKSKKKGEQTLLFQGRPRTSRRVNPPLIRLTIPKTIKTHCIEIKRTRHRHRWLQPVGKEVLGKTEFGGRVEVEVLG